MAQTLLGDGNVTAGGVVRGDTVRAASLAKYEIGTNTKTSDLSQELAAKQDTISDLSTIRSGASAGATAVQSFSAVGGQTPTVTNGVANLSSLFSSNNTSLFGLCRYPIRAIAAADRTTVAATETFDATKTYAVGAYVKYDPDGGTNYSNYVCHTAITTAGAWTGATNWTQNNGTKWTAVDSAVNTDTITAPLVIQPPAATGKTRDFIATVTVSNSVSVTFSPTDGTNTITYVADDWDSIASEDGINLFALTEISANTFMVARKTVAEEE